jgi:hypothetical protein
VETVTEFSVGNKVTSPCVTAICRRQGRVSCSRARPGAYLPTGFAARLTAGVHRSTAADRVLEQARGLLAAAWFCPAGPTAPSSP